MAIVAVSLALFYAIWIRQVDFYMPTIDACTPKPPDCSILERFDGFGGYRAGLLKRLWRLDGLYWIKFASFESSLFLFRLLHVAATEKDDNGLYWLCAG